MDCVIYEIGFDSTEKVYIGVTSNIRERYENHLYELKNGSHHSRELQIYFDAASGSGIYIKEICKCAKAERFAIEKIAALETGSEKLFNNSLAKPRKDKGILRELNNPVKVKCLQTGTVFGSVLLAARWVCSQSGKNDEKSIKSARLCIYAIIKKRMYTHRGFSWEIAE